MARNRKRHYAGHAGEHTCADCGKQSFPTRAAAWKLARLARRGMAEVQVYACGQYFHWGHRNQWQGA